MNRGDFGLYAIVAAIAVVGALALGVPAGTLVALGLVLVCPLMMVLIMRGMHGGGQAQHPADRAERHNHGSLTVTARWEL